MVRQDFFSNCSFEKVPACFYIHGSRPPEGEGLSRTASQVMLYDGFGPVMLKLESLQTLPFHCRSVRRRSERTPPFS
jgi:hypothetical protein